VSHTHYFIGLMSGTSADGIDAALIKSQNNHIELVDFITTDLPNELKHTLIELNQKPEIHLEALCRLNKALADCFTEATFTLLKSAKFNSKQVSAIGSHGQTIFHAPDIPMTLQIAHPAFIAKETEITTVADFRVDDMALAGQGAPFAPAFHQALFTDESACFVVNIGGIANISYLPEKQSTHPIIGWDTGPGNALMDEVCQQDLQTGYDSSGMNARKGQINDQLLNTLLAHPYFAAPHPKSTGRDTFQSNWVRVVINELGIEISTMDLLATLCELTAKSIAEQIRSVKTSKEQNIPVWIVGGGAYNDFLIERLQHHLTHYIVASSEAKNINPNAVEAMMCAWLAEQRMNNKTVPLSAVTGATRDAVLGGIWHP